MTYAFLCMNKTEQEVMELDMALAPPEQKEELVDRQNAQAMQRMMAGFPGGMVGPPKKRPGV